MKLSWIAFVLLAAFSGCGSSGETASNTRDAGQDAITDGTAPHRASSDAGAEACGTVPSSDLPPAASPATGDVAGGNLNAVVCPNGVWARVERAGSIADRFPYYLYVGYTGADNTEPDFEFHGPAGASQGELNAYVGIDSATAGKYSSNGGQACGSVTFTYYLPASPSVNCSGGTALSCPPGCGRVCPASGCAGIPCVPSQDAVSYSASGPSGCFGDGGASTQLGSWQLSLTSAEAGNGGFTPHGTFAATLLAGDGGTSTATVTLDF